MAFSFSRQSESASTWLAGASEADKTQMRQALKLMKDVLFDSIVKVENMREAILANDGALMDLIDAQFDELGKRMDTIDAAFPS